MQLLIVNWAELLYNVLENCIFLKFQSLKNVFIYLCYIYMYYEKLFKI